MISRRLLPSLLAVLVLAVGALAPAASQPTRASSPASRQGGPSWSSLTPAQRGALAPLERDWSTIDPGRKQKWLEIAARMPAMPVEERNRMQARMHEWAAMSGQERGQARLQYQESRQISPQERQRRWEAYQALSPEERRALAERARPAGTEARGQTAPISSRKSNIVPDPEQTARRRAVGPTVVQAKPGATTTLITRRPSPPPHQQVGLPKIAATPDFVDRTTLLPQKGPQGAAARPALPASAAGRR